MEHTKGPWSVGHPTQYHQQHYTPVRAPLHESLPLPTDVAWVVLSEDGGDGNARLIAAAPDLLAACIAIRDHDPEDLISYHNAMDKVDAAIAKAEGK